MVDQLRERTEIRSRAGGRCCTTRRSRATSACGPITVPNHKLLPEVRWALALPEHGVRARSDRHAGCPAPGRGDHGPAALRGAPGAQRLRGSRRRRGAQPRAGGLTSARRDRAASTPGGAADVRDRRDPARPAGRRAADAGRAGDDGGRARAPRPRRRRPSPRRRRRGWRSAGSRSSIPSTAISRSPTRTARSTSSATASSTTTRAAPRPRAARPHVPHRLGRRGARASLRGARPGVRRRPARDVRARALGRQRASARAGPRPVRDQAARLRAHRSAGSSSPPS